MSSKFSFYRIDRTSFTDAMGTLSSSSFLTSSKEALVAAFPAAIHSGAFPDDNLIRAWMTSIESGKNCLKDVWISDLHIENGTGGVRTMKLLPDVVIRGDDSEVRAELVPGPNDLFSFNVRREGAGDLGTDYLSIAAVGRDANLLASLRASGPVEVVLDHSRLIERIPALVGTPLTESLPFRPFYDIEDFRDFVQGELPEALAEKLPGGRDWNGDVPLETWFPAGDLLEACDDAGRGNFDFW